jgi:hypothetical protein
VDFLVQITGSELGSFMTPDFATTTQKSLKIEDLAKFKMGTVFNPAQYILSPNLIKKGALVESFYSRISQEFVNIFRASTRNPNKHRYLVEQDFIFQSDQSDVNNLKLNTTFSRVVSLIDPIKWSAVKENIEKHLIKKDISQNTISLIMMSSYFSDLVHKTKNFFIHVSETDTETGSLINLSAKSINVPMFLNYSALFD